MKKTFLLATLLSIGQALTAQNYFKPGMVWEESTEIISGGVPVEIQLKYFLGDFEEIEGRMAAPMYSERSDLGTSLQCYISTDGNKVYTLCGNTDKEWKLMYDFDISVGETVNVWSTPYLSCNNFGFGPHGVDCLEKNYIPSSCGNIELIRVDDNRYPDSQREIYWISGIGSNLGVTMNCGYGMDGRGGRLLKATFNGKTIYEDANMSQIRTTGTTYGQSEFYNMQGTRVSTPKHGELLIEVTPSGSRKRRF